jgi:hypothetical protein
MRLLVVLALVFGCDGFTVPPQPEGAHPISNAGTGSSYLLGATVNLDGSRSFDPDGSALEYRWSVVQRPPGSTAEPFDGRAATTVFVPDQIGSYRLVLSVTDEARNTDTSELRIVALGAITSVDAGPDAGVSLLGTAALAGNVTTRPGFTATYSWQFLLRPSGSVATIQNSTTLTPTFVADAVGTYVLALTARVGDEAQADVVMIEAITTGVALGSGIVAYTFTTNTNRILYARDVGYAELVSYDPATSTTATANVGAFTPRSIAIDDTSQAVVVGGPNIVAFRSAANLALIGDRAVPGCTAARITLPQQTYRVDCFPADGTIEPIRAVTNTVTEIPCPVKYPDVALSRNGYMYMVDGASSEFYVYDAWATAPLPVLGHWTIAGSAPPVIPAGGSSPYAVTGNGVAINPDGTVRFNLAMPISAGAYGANGELALVSGTQLKIFGTGVGQPTLKQTVTLPSVNGEAPVGRFVAYNSNASRLFVVAGTSAGDVLYTVQR